MAVLRRPKLKKREPDVQTWTPPGAASAPSAPANVYVPSPNAPAAGGRITVAELNAALGTGAAPDISTAPKGGGINVSDLGFALTGGGSASGNRSTESTRHTSYPQGKGDLASLPAKAGSRRGPRTTSYRIPLQRNAQANVYDTLT